MVIYLLSDYFPGVCSKMNHKFITYFISLVYVDLKVLKKQETKNFKLFKIFPF